MLIGAVATAAMFFIRRGDLALASTLFVIAIVGATASFVFTKRSCRTSRSPEIDRVSSADTRLDTSVAESCWRRTWPGFSVPTS
jgi:hypothetical protein